MKPLTRIQKEFLIRLFDLRFRIDISTKEGLATAMGMSKQAFNKMINPLIRNGHIRLQLIPVFPAETKRTLEI